MALIATVTKKSVSLVMPKMWNIVLNLTCTDESVEVINQDFTMTYKTGQDPEIVVMGIEEEMQNTIDAYNSSQVILNHAKLDLGITYLNNNLEG